MTTTDDIAAVRAERDESDAIRAKCAEVIRLHELCGTASPAGVAKALHRIESLAPDLATALLEALDAVTLGDREQDLTLRNLDRCMTERDAALARAEKLRAALEAVCAVWTDRSQMPRTYKLWAALDLAREALAADAQPAPVPSDYRERVRVLCKAVDLADEWYLVEHARAQLLPEHPGDAAGEEP